ncbi:MAG: 5'-nucleotidase C-terminal domain-containing protein [Solobacterium sp.]|nr:5'-nucleotidase C-terminal domain-containing protein [Solobacterium sp.]
MGVRFTPQQSGSFLQVSGLSFEIDLSVPSGCQSDEMGMYAGIEGERRIKNVKVNGEDIVSDQMYTLASSDYILTQNGDGYTMFDGATILQDAAKLDNQVLIDFITEYLGGVIAEEYENPYGQGRINILNGE